MNSIDPCDQAQHDMLIAARDGRISRHHHGDMWIVYIGDTLAGLLEVLVLSIADRHGWITWTPHYGQQYAMTTDLGNDALAILYLLCLDDEAQWQALLHIIFGDVTEEELAEADTDR